jgi:CheY-like chemotaxis protein
VDSPKRILVVEDDDIIRCLVETALADEGYEVAVAADGAIALTHLGTVQPHLILLDMRMPVMDGWQFAAAYRQRPGPHAPIVLLTGEADAAACAAQIQATGCLSKPFRIGELSRCVARYSDPIS